MRGVTFWTEGGTSIGMGHLSRCINIAHATGACGLPVHFLTNDDPAVSARLADSEISRVTFPIDSPNAARFTRLSTEVVVIDTKRDVSELVKGLKSDGRKVVLIDNLTGAEDADLVVLPTAFERDRARGEKIRSGGEFVIIGPNFIDTRHTMDRLPYALPLKVLVTMGGADPFNLTEQVVDALKGMKGVDVTVVLGPAFEASESLVEFMANGGSGFRFLHGVKDMAPLMNSTHVAFTAVGTTINELAYMGVPSIVISNYRQDSADLDSIEGLGIGVSLGYHEDVGDGEIRDAVEGFIRDKSKWDLMSWKASQLTDGLGAVRIARLVAGLVQKDMEGTDEQTGFNKAKHA